MNGNPGLPTHWPVRRYVNEFDGPVTISGQLKNAGDWVFVTQTGVAANSLLYVYLTGVGDGYIDDIRIVAGVQAGIGPNLLPNGDFETGSIAPWTVSTNLAGSDITTAEKRVGNASLHLVSTAGGSSQSNSVWQTIVPALVNGQTYTLSYWFKPGAVVSPVVVQMSGNWLNTTALSCGDGVTGRIFVDGTPVYQQTVLASVANFSFTTPAHSGSKIDFLLDPGVADNDLCDSAMFNATITTADPSLAIVASSTNDWSVTGTQGEKNWYYGYYNKTADPDQTYQAANFTPFPRSSGPQSPSNFWDEEEWDWFNGNPPFDQIGQYWMRPNGLNSGAEHWVIRRWVSEVSGNVSLEWTAFKAQPDQYNYGGGGVRVRIFQNGVQSDLANIRSNDVAGVRRTINLTGVNVGDTFDIALDPTNADGNSHDDSDRTFVTMTLRGYRTLTSQITSDIGASMQNVNPSAYLRLPFTVANPALFNSLTLRIKYDDGFLAYLNGVEVARGNAPMFPEWNSAAAST